VTRPNLSSDVRDKRLANLNDGLRTFGINEDVTAIISQMNNQVRDDLDLYA
jgi:hypothetical protein